MTLENTLDQLHQGTINNYQFRDRIKNYNKSNVVKGLYTKRFGYPAVMTIRNTAGYPYNDVKKILHKNEVYTQFKVP